MGAAIICEGLTKRYKHHLALNQLDLEVKEKVILGFLGVNGAGKTTTIKLLNHLILPTSGDAFIEGISIKKNPIKLRKSMGYLSQVPALYPWMTGRELLKYVGEIFKITPQKLRNNIEELLQLVDLSDAADRRIGGYSTGMKQRLGIAQALINDPRIILFDEPVSALDPLGRIDVLNIIQSLKGKATIFMSSHILNDIERVCDEVAIIDHGELIRHTDLVQLKQQYLSPVIQILCSENPKSLAKELESLDEVRRIQSTPVDAQIEMKIYCSDINRVEKIIPSLLVKHHLTIKKYDLLSPTLEDIFVSLVQTRHKDK